MRRQGAKGNMNKAVKFFAVFAAIMGIASGVCVEANYYGAAVIWGIYAIGLWIQVGATRTPEKKEPL
jgi:hypothetical protein